MWEWDRARLKEWEFCCRVAMRFIQLNCLRPSQAPRIELDLLLNYSYAAWHRQSIAVGYHSYYSHSHYSHRNRWLIETRFTASIRHVDWISFAKANSIRTRPRPHWLPWPPWPPWPREWNGMNWTSSHKFAIENRLIDSQRLKTWCSQQIDLVMFCLPFVPRSLWCVCLSICTHSLCDFMPICKHFILMFAFILFFLRTYTLICMCVGIAYNHSCIYTYT